jgi:hypothetical protein
MDASHGVTIIGVVGALRVTLGWLYWIWRYTTLAAPAGHLRDRHMRSVLFGGDPEGVPPVSPGMVRWVTPSVGVPRFVNPTWSDLVGGGHDECL